MEKNTKVILLRVTPELKSELIRLASLSNRSLNNYIVTELMFHVGARSAVVPNREAGNE